MANPTLAEDRFCVNPDCPVGRWFVILRPGVNQVWRIESAVDEDAYFVSAPTPLCPCCAEPLLTSFDLEGGFTEEAAGEDGPLFEFVRQLS